MKRIASTIATFWCAGFALFALTTGFFKFSDLSAFAETLKLHGLVPAALTHFVAISVASSEIVMSTLALVWLMGTSSCSRGALLLNILLLVFLAYTAALWLKPPPQPAACGCGLSRAPIESWGGVALRNAALLAITMVCQIAMRRLLVTRPSASNSPITPMPEI